MIAVIDDSSHCSAPNCLYEHKGKNIMNENKAKESQVKNIQGVLDALYKSAEIPGDKDYWYKRSNELEAELESLKRERAMLVDAGLEIANEDVRFRDWDKFRTILSATEPQAAQWLNDKLTDAKIEQMKVFESWGEASDESVEAELRRLA